MNRLLRSLLLLAALCSALGCAHRPILPVLTPPSVSMRRDTIPPAPLSTSIIPIGVPLAGLHDVLRQNVTLPSVAEWSQISAPGDSPEISVRYQTELGAPVVSTQGAAVRIVLPIFYFGSLRARAHTPFGWMWLTRETAWGTSARRGTIEVQIDTTLNVRPSWELEVRSSLSDVRLTAPAIEKLCTSGVFKVCVPAEWVRERVHRELDRQVRAQAARAIARADAEVRAKVNLPQLLRTVWDRLQAPAAREGAQTLYLVPHALALGPVVVRDDTLLLPLRVGSAPRWSEGASPETRELPPAAEVGQAARDEVFDMSVSTDAMSERLTRGLSALADSGGEWRVRALSLLGASEAAGRWIVAATVANEQDSAVVYGDAALVLDGTHVRLGDLRWSPASRELLTLARVPPEALATQLSQAVRAELEDILRARVDALHAALERSVSPWPVQIQEGRVALEAAYAADRAVVLRVRVQ